MQFLKISCTQCMHYQDCPQKTRMYVNYCGADIKRVKEQVRMATIDCRTRRGLLFAQNLLSGVSAATEITALIPVST